VRFRYWRIYGEHGLARRQAAVWLYGESLLLGFSGKPFAQYSVAYEPDHRHLREVVPRQLFETQHRSSLLALWELGAGEWLKVARLPRREWPGKHRGALQHALTLESAGSL